LFVLCDENASKFSQQVGYGNAIGFLVNKGIAMEPPSAADGADDGPGGSHSGGHRPVHPITGQYLDVQDDGPSLAEMTDEEKEREAERLFVLFERLKKTGVVNVENPVAKAYQ
ncbi:guanine nucleotide exchange factor, partial [Gongronella butleri]